MQSKWTRRRAWLPVQLSIVTSVALAQVPDDPTSVSWASYRDMQNQAFVDHFADLSSRGYRVIDVEGDTVSGTPRYAAVWQETDGRGWAEWRNMTSSGYHDKWVELRDLGFRPIDVDCYYRNSDLRYAGCWVENTEGLAWASWRNLTNDEFKDKFEHYRSRGYMPIDVEAYPVGNQLRYAVIWVENHQGLAWGEWRGMSQATWVEKWNDYRERGYRVLDFESYMSGSNQRYAGIWVENRDGRGWASYRDMSEQSWWNRWRMYRDMGYRLIDFELYEAPGGWRYAGVWRQNSDRLTWGPRGRIDGIVEAYRVQSNLPGISVAITQNGRVVYCRGFGEADAENGVAAHSRTIYSAASVSKAIGGALAVRLSERVDVDLDFTDPTSDYLPGLPAQHTHAVQDILSHVGCVRHYSNLPGGSAIPLVQYGSALAASQTFWNDALLPGCTIGVTDNYSTHAFTLVGAVLESVTGDTIQDLVRDEIAEPFGLTSLRRQFPLTSTRDRTQFYELDDRSAAPDPDDNPNEVVGLANNSWKVLGGGLEISAYDLARFGARVLDGDVVSAAGRDNVMWNVLNATRSYGLGWVVDWSGRVASRRRSHNGSWAGTFTQLNLYQDQDIAVAIMSNRRDHVGSIGGLADQLAAITAGLE